MDEQKHSLIDRLHQAQNILVTVSRNPSVDQLSAAIGLTLALNKLDKHGTAVFSGQVPSTLEFLKPGETLEKDTNSLRDFIIALDKSKADKLRYKVEDQVVRIFITPYRTSLSQNDLEFSQGDFNVDVVVALGVTEQQDLDQAITSHGRILHDATVASVSTQGQGSLGSINWVDPSASSLSEMVVGLVDGLDKKVMDNQIATALLTGIVASTDRFRNEKTSPKTMSASAELMAAGANQQLIASELETPPEPAPQPEQSPENQNEDETPPEEHKPEPGTLEIDHEAEEETAEPEAAAAPEEKHPQVHVDENGQLVTDEEEQLPEISQVRGVGNDGHPTENHPEFHHERIMEPPMGESNITANINPESYDPSTEELTLPAVTGPILTHNENVLPPADAPKIEVPEPEAPEPVVPEFKVPESAEPEADMPHPSAPFAPPTPPPMPPVDDVPPIPAADTPSAEDSFEPDATLSEIEAAVDSPHVHPDAASANPIDDARSAVEAALNGTNDPLKPIAALNAQPLGTDLHTPAEPATEPAPQVPNLGFSEPTPGNTPADETLDMPLPNTPFGPGQTVQPASPNPLIPQNPAPAAPFTPPAPQPQAPPSAFPGAPAPQQSSGQNLPPPPPVPPPMLPPLQP